MAFPTFQWPTIGFGNIDEGPLARERRRQLAQSMNQRNAGMAAGYAGLSPFVSQGMTAAFGFGAPRPTTLFEEDTMPTSSPLMGNFGLQPAYQLT